MLNDSYWREYNDGERAFLYSANDGVLAYIQKKDTVSERSWAGWEGKSNKMIYLAIGNAIFMLGYIIGKICAAYEYNKTSLSRG